MTQKDRPHESPGVGFSDGQRNDRHMTEKRRKNGREAPEKGQRNACEVREKGQRMRNPGREAGVLPCGAGVPAVLEWWCWQ